MWVPGSWAEWMELAEDVFTKAIHILGINNWQRRMEQLLPDTTSSSEPPLAQKLSNHILSWAFSGREFVLKSCEDFRAYISLLAFTVCLCIWANWGGDDLQVKVRCFFLGNDEIIEFGQDSAAYYMTLTVKSPLLFIFHSGWSRYALPHSWSKVRVQARTEQTSWLLRTASLSGVVLCAQLSPFTIPGLVSFLPVLPSFCQSVHLQWDGHSWCCLYFWVCLTGLTASYVENSSTA